MEKVAAAHGHVIGIPVGSKAFPAEQEASQESFSRGKNCSLAAGCRRGDNLAQGIKEHVALGANFSETVKGKLSLGKRILQAGGIDRVFKQSFSPEKGEALIRASQCYLSTSAGPIAGMLFISTHKIAFRSDKSVAVTAFDGGVVRVPYKVCIPLRRVRKVNPSENADKPEQKYMRVATVDGFEFWFMGFVSYHKSFLCIQQAIAALR